MINPFARVNWSPGGTWLYRIWFAVGSSVGIVISNTALALIYYVVLTPIGLVRRMLRVSPFRSRPDAAATSYWTDVESSDDPNTYTTQF